MSSQPWEEIDHTADWALRVRGGDLRALFENAARGMMSLLGSPRPPKVTLHRTLSLTANDLETLLVDWLTELLYLIEDEGVVFSEIAVHRVEGLALEAEVRGGPSAEPETNPIKAVTYHMLNIRQTDDGYVTTIVFDV